MYTIEQIKTGLVRYVESEMMPHLNVWKQLALGAYIELALPNWESIAKKVLEHPAISMLGIVDGCTVDTDKALNAFGARMRDKLTLDIPILGAYTITRSDIDRLTQYIREA